MREREERERERERERETSERERRERERQVRESEREKNKIKDTFSTYRRTSIVLYLDQEVTDRLDILCLYNEYGSSFDSLIEEKKREREREKGG